MISRSLAIVAVLLTAVALAAESPVKILGPEVGQSFPHKLAAVDQAGKTQSLKSLMGEKGLAVFFVRSADWCPFCKGQLVDANRHLARFRELGVSVVSISVDEVAPIAAFAPDRGESVATLIKDPPPGAPVPPILPPQQGFLELDRAKFAASFAADVAPEKAEFMANSQVPWGLDALNGAITQPAWKSKPSWYLVATDDRMIPPPAQRVMSKRAGSTVVEVKGSHAVYVSQPEAVAQLIKNAARSFSTK